MSPHKIPSSKAAITSSFWQSAVASVVLPNPPAPLNACNRNRVLALFVERSRARSPNSFGRGTKPVSTRRHERYARNLASAIQMRDELLPLLLEV
jgi:hypothetical protein